jgi:UDP-glucuronate 4-epimerase
MAKILLTGVAGFIGSHLYKKLMQNHHVIAIDNLTDFSNYEIKQRRAKALFGERLEHPNFFFQNINDRESLAKRFETENFDAVVHLAAMTGVRESIKKPSIYEQVNVNGFLNILEACRNFGVNRLIYASSSSVYGGNQEIPFKETVPIENLLNFYAVTKRMNELAAENYANLYGINSFGLRFFTVYGPWTRPDMATFSFIKNISEGNPITLFNKGNLQRDFTYVDDIVFSINLLLDKLLSEPIKEKHMIFNVGEGQPIIIKDFVAVLEKHLKKKAILEFAPMNKEEMVCTFADCEKLFGYTGFKPQTSIEEGLKKTVDWYLKEYSIT